MRCPKCQYISFDSGDRCRNCGYEFSLTVEGGELDLPLKTGEEAIGPFSDFSLSDVEGLHTPAPQEPIPTPTAQPARTSSRAVPSADLPLFGDRRTDDDAPLVSLPATPRAPVAVRKSSPAVRPVVQRSPATAEPELELDFPDEPVARPAHRAIPAPAAPATEATPEGETAAPGARALAALVDGVLILGIDAGVLYFTLRIAGLQFSEIALLPIMPFVAFLAVLNGGYVAGLTAAGGQSIGKMAAGIRVVTADPDAWTDRVPLSQAVLRAVGYVVSALPAGLGFLPAFIGAERRALHDRLARTRVVKA